MVITFQSEGIIKFVSRKTWKKMWPLKTNTSNDESSGFDLKEADKCMICGCPCRYEISKIAEEYYQFYWKDNIFGNAHGVMVNVLDNNTVVIDSNLQ